MFRSLQKKSLSSWRSAWAACLKQMSVGVAALCCMGQTCCRHALWAQSQLTVPWQRGAGGGWAERVASGPREPVWLPLLHCSPLCSLWRIAWWLPTTLSKGTLSFYWSRFYQNVNPIRGKFDSLALCFRISKIWSSEHYLTKQKLPWWYNQISYPSYVSDEHVVTHLCWQLLPSSRLVCVVPPAVAPPSHLYAANPPVPYSLEQKSLHRRLQEASAAHSAGVYPLASRHISHFPDLQLMQMDSG